MSTPIISMIFAVDEGNGIGFNNGLPWAHHSEDMKWFQKHTKGKVVVMGRRTWESLPEQYRPLPDRTNVVLTRSVDDPVHSRCDFETVLLEHSDAEEIVIIGGAETYKRLAQHVTRVYITQFDGINQADTYMETNVEDWHLVFHDQFTCTDVTFQIYQKLEDCDQLVVDITNPGSRVRRPIGY